MEMQSRPNDERMPDSVPHDEHETRNDTFQDGGQQPDSVGVSSSQGKPPELPTLMAEIVFVIVCTMGQLLFAIFLADTMVNQVNLVDALGNSGSLLPWLIGSFLLTNGISDLICVFSIKPSRMVLYFFVRAMQGLAVGVLESTAMNMLGRIYKPWQRKPCLDVGNEITMGFGVGALQGGAFSAHLEWVFGSTTILSTLCAVAAYFTMPSLKPSSSDATGNEALSIKHFDFLGAALSAGGCGFLVISLTQGAPAHWTPALIFVAFYFAERWVSRPLIDNRLWKTPGFLWLMGSYFLGYGAYVVAWMFYAVRFFLTIQDRPPIIADVYLLPVAVSGTIATWVVAKTLHIISGHYIMILSMIAFTLGPVFFLPRTEIMIYWALSFPGLILSTFGPDMSFAAASIFISSNVPRPFQGAAGSS
ncbi:hypothetical protein MW887_002305 [Aspergillus wentii]|nr:hypothetical protein MW887_002305 [Aspergillus wentii]